MSNIFIFLISLCLAGCVSKKDVQNDKAVAIAVNRKDVMPTTSTEHPYKGSLDIKSAKDYKVPAVENTAPSTHSLTTPQSSPRPAQEPPPGARDPMTERLVDRKSPQARHEKMINETSSVISTGASGSRWANKNFRK